ncbi:hypothetical protein LCGC14_2069160, partial [marine sediment metagenome]
AHTRGKRYFVDNVVETGCWLKHNFGEFTRNKKNIYQRLWAILLYGSVALYVLLLVTKIGAVATLALPLLIGVAINYAILAFVVTTAAKRFKFLRI